MNFNIAKLIYNYLFAGRDGYLLSFQSQKVEKISQKDLTYGEIDFDSFAQILNDAEIDENHLVFYDLGSGIGKAVIAASLLEDKFKGCFGIEILNNLYQASQEVLSKFNEEVRPLLAGRSGMKIDFFAGNFFDFDLRNGGVVFVQTTCMTESTIETLAKHLSALKPGSIVITATKELPKPFTVYKKKSYQMGWGSATIYFHRR